MNTNNKALQGFKKVNDSLLGIETFLLALITILLVAAIFIEVVCRYFLFISAAWAEELTRYLFIWLTYIGSAYAICDNSHTEIDVLKQVLNKIKGPSREKWLKALEVAAIVSTFAFLVVFGKLFFSYMMKIFATTQTSPTMRIPHGLGLSAGVCGHRAGSSPRSVYAGGLPAGGSKACPACPKRRPQGGQLRKRVK